MLPAAYHIDDSKFIQQSIKKLPFRFKKYINYNYSNTFNRSGRAAANLQLLDLQDSLSRYDLAKDDDEIIQQAKICAKECSYKVTLDFKKAYAIKKGITPPECETERGEWNRLVDEYWWRRQLRKVYGREIEKTAIKLGMVSKSREIYASNESLLRRQQQNRRNASLLETLAATNENGDTYTLKELSDLTTSNPELKRNELMTRIRGFEEIAKSKNDVGMFYTVTCPSRFHKKAMAKNGHAYDNPKYKQLTPRDAQSYLTSVWARTRASLHRSKIKPYGFRVAEPQHDGTPHWHLLLFIPEEQQAETTKIFRKYALQDTPNEAGAQKHRFTPVKIDPDKGTAAGYIAKYIAKNIDGYAIDCDLFGNDPIKAAARVQAWAATWGIRQFQQIGGASVTQWRNLRKMPEPEQKNNPFYAAWKHADAGDWAAFNKTVEKNPIKKLVAWNDKENRYGERIGNQAFAYEYDNVIYPLQVHAWTIKRVENEGSYFRDEQVKDALRNEREKRKGKPDYRERGAGIFGYNVPPMPEGGNKKQKNSGDHIAHIIKFYLSTRKVKTGEYRAHVDIYKRGLMLGKRSAAPWTCVNNCTAKT